MRLRKFSCIGVMGAALLFGGSLPIWAAPPSGTTEEISLCNGIDLYWTDDGGGYWWFSSGSDSWTLATANDEWTQHEPDWDGQRLVLQHGFPNDPPDDWSQNNAWYLILSGGAWIVDHSSRSFGEESSESFATPSLGPSFDLAGHHYEGTGCSDTGGSGLSEATGQEILQAAKATLHAVLVLTGVVLAFALLNLLCNRLLGK